MSSSRVIPRMVSYVFYEDDPEHYTGGGCQVFLYGDRGFMFAIFGRSFFAEFLKGAEHFMVDNGLSSLEGYMSPANARSVRIGCRSYPNLTVTIDHPKEIDNHKVVWVSVTKISKGDASSVTSSM